MLWIKNEQREIWKQTRYFLPPSSYVDYFLTGGFAVDHRSAGSIGGVHDMKNHCWSKEALEMLDIPMEIMPPS